MSDLVGNHIVGFPTRQLITLLIVPMELGLNVPSTAIVIHKQVLRSHSQVTI